MELLTEFNYLLLTFSLLWLGWNIGVLLAYSYLSITINDFKRFFDWLDLNFGFHLRKRFVKPKRDVSDYSRELSVQLGKLATAAKESSLSIKETGELLKQLATQ